MTDLSASTDYNDIVSQVKGLVAGETDMIANMANISAVLFQYMDEINWAGFYIMRDGQLVLGPFQGKPACIRIPLGKGVCGTAAQSGDLQVVEDVHQFDGHIACDAASNSEIVLPVIVNNEVVAVLDIDSPKFARFGDRDAKGLGQVVDALQDTLS